MHKDLLEKVKNLVMDVSAIAKHDGQLQIKEKGAKDYVTETDLKISEALIKGLPSLLEGSIVISEEGDQRNLDNRFCWIIDPIDGTSNYIFGWREFCISVGLFENGTSVLGVVYSPGTGEMFYAAKDEGAFCNGERIHVSSDHCIGTTLVLAETNPYCDRMKNKYINIFKKVFMDCVDYRITGSAALDCCYVACGRGGLLMAENLKPWDYAAGEIIIHEAGGMFTDWKGRKPDYIGNFEALASNGLIHNEAMNILKTF